MKVLFLLFLVFIKYSYSVDIKYVSTNNILTTLNSTINDGYFYFIIESYTSHDYLYLYLFDNNYNLNNTISYCQTRNYSLQEINSCNFKSRYCDDYDYPGSSKGYYYKIPLSYSRSNYLIIKYSGSNNYGTIKARGSFQLSLKR